MNNNNQLNISSTEISFWKIIKNKLLFKKILSNFIFKNEFDYDSLFGVNNIIQNFKNSEAIIKDKIKSNKYLLKNNLEILTIFELIRNNNQENQMFYKQLFRDYKFNINSIEVDSKLKINNSNFWVPSIIKKNNLVALIQYINIFNLNIQSMEQIIKNNFQNIKQSFQSYHGRKIYNHLVENKFLPSVNYNIIDITLVYKNNNVFHESFKFKYLFDLYQFLINNFVNEKDLNEKYKNIIIELNSIQMDKFSKNQLKLNIRDLLLSSSSSEFLSIKLLLYKFCKVIYKVYRLYNKDESYKNKNYYIFFKDLKQIKQNLNQPTIFEFFDDILQITFRDKLEESKQLIQEYLYEKNFNFNLIYQTNNFELIKFVFMNASQIILNSPKGLKSNFLISINSNRVLDYLFENYQNEFYSDRNCLWIYISNLKVLEHYENQMKRLNRKFLITKPSNDPGTDYIYYRIILEIIERALHDSSLYEIDDSFTLDILSVQIRLYLENNKQDYIIQFFKTWLKYRNGEDNNKVFSNIKNKKICKLLYWVFSKSKDQDLLDYVEDLKNYLSPHIIIRSGTDSNGYTKELKFKFDNIASLFQCVNRELILKVLEKDHRLFPFFIKVISYDSMYTIKLFIDHILLNINTNKEFKTYLFNLLSIQSCIGNLEIFTYLLSKNSNILNFNIVLESHQINQLIRDSMINRNDELSYFFLRNINFIPFESKNYLKEIKLKQV